MTTEQRHDRDLVPALDSRDNADQAATNDARAKRMHEIREQLTRPITVGEFRRLEAPHRSERLRKHIFGSDEPFDFLRELRKRREAREAGGTNE
jgi:hypothetical protein